MSRTIKARWTPVATLERIAAALRVLAHAQRLQIVERLLERNHTVGELAEALDLAPSACSQHLNLMRAHGLLQSRRDGRAVYYEVTDPAVVSVVDCIHKHHPTK